MPIIITITVGTPGSGKSTWVKEQIAKYPKTSARINNDSIRAMLNGGVFFGRHEKIVRNARLFLIRQCIDRGIESIYIDNVNADPKYWNEVCRVAKESGQSVTVVEKLFYVPLEMAVERDSKRIGVERVGRDVIERFWLQLGGESFSQREPKTETFVGVNDEITDNDGSVDT